MGEYPESSLMGIFEFQNSSFKSIDLRTIAVKLPAVVLMLFLIVMTRGFEMIEAIAMIEAECSVGAKRSLGEFPQLDCVRAFAWCPLAFLAAVESFGSEDDMTDSEYDAKNEKGYAKTEKGSEQEAGYHDRIALERKEKAEKQNRVDMYQIQGEKNHPIDYDTDDSIRMEAAMHTFLRFCDLLADAPDVPEAK